jgi:hypothetical protein
VLHKSEHFVCGSSIQSIHSIAICTLRSLPREPSAVAFVYPEWHRTRTDSLDLVLSRKMAGAALQWLRIDDLILDERDAHAALLPDFAKAYSSSSSSSFSSPSFSPPSSSLLSSVNLFFFFSFFLFHRRVFFDRPIQSELHAGNQCAKTMADLCSVGCMLCTHWLIPAGTDATR